MPQIQNINNQQFNKAAQVYMSAFKTENCPVLVHIHSIYSGQRLLINDRIPRRIRYPYMMRSWCFVSKEAVHRSFAYKNPAYQ